MTEPTYGERAVGLTFNPSNNSKVDVLKAQAASFIDSCNDWRLEATSPEIKRMYSVAITEAQTAQMWAVKAATWREESTDGAQQSDDGTGRSEDGRRRDETPSTEDTDGG